MGEQCLKDNTGGLLTLFSKNLRRQCIKMEKVFVAESIGNQYTEWNALDPVFIDAPTGTRKTTFVYEKIIPEAIGQKRTVLLVSNRIAVSAQQKRKILELLKRYDPDSVSHITENPDKEIVDKLAFFGPVCVTTYQGLHRLLHSTEDSETNMYEWFARLKYVVFDEIHFLYSDALFNASCEYLLKKIPWVFRNAVRVYMTATSWEIKDLIYEQEKYVLSTSTVLLTWQERYISDLIPADAKFADPCKAQIRPYRIFYDYCMEADYSAYRLHFFSSDMYIEPEGGRKSAYKGIHKKYLMALLNQMSNSLPGQDNKWMIFVDKKSSGRALLKALRAMNISAAYIDAAEKDPKSAWKQLINEETLETSVLIATSVIECGVNVSDNTVRHIAILCTDRTAFIQLLGRKRRSKDEIVDLWVWLPDYEYFDGMKKKMGHYLRITERLRSVRKKLAEIKIGTEELFFYKAQYAAIAKELWNARKTLEYETLFRIDNQGMFAVNQHVWETLYKRYCFMRQCANKYDPNLFERVVEYWLGIKGSNPTETNEETAENIGIEAKFAASECERWAEEITALSMMLKQKAEENIQEKDFKPIRKSIVDLALSTGVFEKKKTNIAKKDSVAAVPLNRYLKSMGIPYTLNRKSYIWTITPIVDEQ